MFICYILHKTLVFFLIKMNTFNQQFSIFHFIQYQKINFSKNSLSLNISHEYLITVVYRLWVKGQNEHLNFKI